MRSERRARVRIPVVLGSVGSGDRFMELFSRCFDEIGKLGGIQGTDSVLDFRPLAPR